MDNIINKSTMQFTKQEQKFIYHGLNALRNDYQEKYEDSEYEVKYFKDKYYAVWSLMEKIQEYENN
jgi:hypothetical protein